jgi:hypothetical protein
MFTEAPRPEYQQWAGERIAALLPPGEPLIAYARIARSPGLADEPHRHGDEFNPFAGITRVRGADAALALTMDSNPGQQDAVSRGKSLRRWGRIVTGGQDSAAFALLAALRQHTDGQQWAAVTPYRLIITVERPPNDRGVYGDAGLMMAKTPLNLLARLRGGPTVAERLAQRQLRRLAHTAMNAVYHQAKSGVRARPMPPDPELRRVTLQFADASTLVLAVSGGPPGDALMAALT